MAVFRNTVAYPILLEGDWRVGLADIIFPSSSKLSMTAVFFILRLKGGPDMDQKRVCIVGYPKDYGGGPDMDQKRVCIVGYPKDNGKRNKPKFSDYHSVF